MSRLEVVIKTARDLSRQVVKSDYAIVTVPEIALTIPQLSQKGEITTVEGIISRTKAGLEQEQPVRLHMDPAGYKQIAEYILKIQELLDNEREFTLVVEDPSGNSFIENPNAPAPDQNRKEKHFERTKKQNHVLGLYSEEELAETEDSVLDQEAEVDDRLTEEKLKEEVLHFETNCPNCNAPAVTNMKMTCIPFFKEVVIMATVCDACGVKTNEVEMPGFEEMNIAFLSLKSICHQCRKKNLSCPGSLSAKLFKIVHEIFKIV